MSTSTGAKKKRIKSAEEFLESQSVQTTKEAEKAQTTSVLDESKFESIEANTFYQIMFDESVSPEEKRDAVVAALTFAEDNEQAQQSLEEFNKFKEYLQFQRKRMAQEIIALNNTETNGVLQQVINELNTGLLNFEELMGPLVEGIEAINTLSLNGVTIDVFNEIIQDQEKEETRKAEEEHLAAEVNGIREKNRMLRVQNGQLANQKGFLGFGGTTKSALNEIAANEVTMAGNEERLSEIQTKLEDVRNSGANSSEFAEFAAEKEKLKEFLNLTSSEHKERQESVVKAAQDFIGFADGNTGMILEHLQKESGQMKNLGEANFTIRNVYAILNDATNRANSANEGTRAGLKTATEGDDYIAQMKSEKQLTQLEDYIADLNQSSVDTTRTYGELTASGHQIRTMQETNEQSTMRMRQMHSSGVAGIADNLSTVLTAVSAAALKESSTSAEQTLRRMRTTTLGISKNNAIAAAMGGAELNQELEKVFEDLQDYGKVIGGTTKIMRENLKETKKLREQIVEQGNQMQEAIKESIGVAADVVAEKSPANDRAPNAPKNKASGPFKLG